MQAAASATEALETNAIYCGDCLEVLNSFPPESVDLVYVDPPFGSGEDYEIVFKDGVEVRHFKDRWIGGRDSYIDWMAPRIRAIHQVLKRTGSFYLHCDYHLNAHLRILCDKIFQEGNFRNEIIWKRKDAQSSARRYGVVNDTILYYTKSDDYTWNKVYTELSKKTAESWYKKREIAECDVTNRKGEVVSKGTVRHYNLADVSAPGPRIGTRAHYEWKGKWPRPGTHWRYIKERMLELEREGRLVHTSSGWPYEKRYLDESKGTPPQTIWADISMMRGIFKHSRDSKYKGFPTQKPVPLLERIISISSNPGDLVLDPMCGCGTTIVGAHTLKRSWIGIDISPTACKIMANWLRSEHVPITEDDIIGLPRSVREIKEMVKLDSIEFQNWVCGKLGAVSTTPRGNAPRPDKNVDGWIMNTIPIQVKGSDGVGYAEVQRFETTLQTLHSKEGYIVAFSFSKPAYEEAYRARRENGLLIDLLELEETRFENSLYPRHPEVYTILKSKITNRVWGTHAQTTTETSGETHEPNLDSWANKTLEDTPSQKMQGSLS